LTRKEKRERERERERLKSRWWGYLLEDVVVDDVVAVVDGEGDVVGLNAKDFIFFSLSLSLSFFFFAFVFLSELRPEP
jgi:hypothetical protein